jgi:hypothetical protein
MIAQVAIITDESAILLAGCGRIKKRLFSRFHFGLVVVLYLGRTLSNVDLPWFVDL